jgi:hypothetical protein
MAIKEISKVLILLTVNTLLSRGAKIVMLGITEMRNKFSEIYMGQV